MLMQKKLGRALHKAREVAGSSLDAIAVTAKISGAYLHKLEHGVVDSPSPRVLARIAAALEMPYLQLMELAGYLSEEEANRARKRKPSPSPHPLADKDLSQEEWREVGAFIEAQIAKRNAAEARD